MLKALKIIGLVLDALGAIIVLLPGFSIMRYLDRAWPLNQIEAAKEILYLDGELLPEDPGFSYIESAITLGIDPLFSSPRIDQAEGFQAHIEIEGEVIEVEKPGLKVVKIEKPNSDPLPQAEFDIHYEPNLYEELPPRFHGPKLVGTLPPGSLSRKIEEHKERVVFRFGAGLLATGFLLQLLANLF